MKMALEDARQIERLSAAQRGVFSKADLQTILAERHATAFARRLRALEASGVLRRFVRGWYVGEEFDLPTLSQRLAPRSYVSFGWVLANELVVGTASRRELVAAKLGRTRTYEGLGYRIVHVGVAQTLFFGFGLENGVRFADAEKATLDVLYFHLRGRGYPFDVYTDIRFEALDRKRLELHLARNRNPKFVAFVRALLEGDEP